MNYKEVFAIYIAMAIGVGIGFMLNQNDVKECETEEVFFFIDNNETNATNEIFFIEDDEGVNNE